MTNQLRINIHNAAPNVSVSSRDSTIWLDVPILAGEITCFLDPATAKRVGESLIEAADRAGRIAAIDAERAGLIAAIDAERAGRIAAIDAEQSV